MLAPDKKCVSERMLPPDMGLFVENLNKKKRNHFLGYCEKFSVFVGYYPRNGPTETVQKVTAISNIFLSESPLSLSVSCFDESE